MTVENTTTTSEALESNLSEVEAGEGLSAPEVEEGAQIDPESDPNESFSDWLKRKEAEKAKTEVEEKSEPEPEPEPKEQEIEIDGEKYTVEKLKEVVGSAKQYQQQLQTFQQQAQQLVKLLREEPGKILDKLETKRELIEDWYFKKFLEPETLTPEERQHRAEREELERLRAELEGRKSQEEQQARAQRQAQLRQQWETKIKEALSSTGLPNTEWTVSRVAAHIKYARTQGKTNATPADVMPAVKAEWDRAQQQLLANATPEQLKALLGQEALDRLRQAEVSKYKQDKFTNNAKPTSSRGKSKTPEKKFTNVYQLLDEL